MLHFYVLQTQNNFSILIKQNQDKNKIKNERFFMKKPTSNHKYLITIYIYIIHKVATKTPTLTRQEVNARTTTFAGR